MTRSEQRKIHRSMRPDVARPQPRRHSLLAGGLSLASAIIACLNTAQAQEATSSASLEEVVVTAQKRTESLQNVPLSITALGTQQLEDLHVQNFDDYVKYLPSVTIRTVGPGQDKVYMRGVSSGGDGVHSGTLPSVGVYLDEQPVTTIQGVLDIHVYDIARVEALAGPQGTLYGASSEAGTLRITTHKPDPTAFKAAYEVQGNYVDHGDPGGLIQGLVNVPLSSNAAVRLVGWYERDGGYIGNMFANRTFPQFGVMINNAAVAKNKFNDVTVYGARAALKVNLDDNWSVTPFVMAQNTKANGFGAFN